MSQAKELVEYNLDTLREHAVWLFSSGPIAPVKDEADEIAKELTAVPV